MRATSPTWLFTPSTRGALWLPRLGEAPRTERCLLRRERFGRRFEHRFESRLRDPPRVSGSCLPPIPRWACPIRKGLAEGEARRVVAVVGALEAAGAPVALAAAGEEGPAVAAEQAAPGAVEQVAVGAREVRVAERVVEARGAERAAECRIPTSTIRRTISRGPSFRLFQLR